MSEGTPATFGDVTGEYLALVRGAGLVAARHDLVWVRGTDVVAFLDGLLSQRIEGASPGEVRRSLLLAPNGKLRAVLYVLTGVDEVGLVADEGVGSTVVGDLNRFKIRVDVAIEHDDRRLVEVWGPDASRVIRDAGYHVPSGWHQPPFVGALPFPAGLVPRYLLADIDEDAVMRAGAVPVGRQAADAVRVELGEPIVGVDLDEKTIPQEAALVADTVDFEKGCYLGQELVARIDSRGHVNRQLRGVVVTNNVLPPVGADVLKGGIPVGTVTSIAESLDLHAPVGLATLRREVQLGDEVAIRWERGATSAIVRDLPLRDGNGA